MLERFDDGDVNDRMVKGLFIMDLGQILHKLLEKEC